MSPSDEGDKTRTCPIADEDAARTIYHLPIGAFREAIRGSPGTLVQLQVLPADAPPDAAPRTVAVVRGQIKYKR